MHTADKGNDPTEVTTMTQELILNFGFRERASGSWEPVCRYKVIDPPTTWHETKERRFCDRCDSDLVFVFDERSYWEPEFIKCKCDSVMRPLIKAYEL